MNRAKTYTKLLEQAKSLIDSSLDDIVNMANISALLRSTFDFHWIGFYRVQGNRLVLGPFQGPVACTTIAYGKGVCGIAWNTKETQIVADVHQFPGHIACSALSNSEIVVPCLRNNEVYAVLDLDSENFNDFNKIDANFLEELVGYL